MRMCCGCNQRFDQRRLIRLQVSPETQALIPVDKRQVGRSAWVCCNIVCIRKVQTHPKKLQRSLRTRPRMDSFLTVLYSWMHNRVQQMLNRLQRDGAISFKTERLSDSTFSDVYLTPSELSNHIRLNAIDSDHTPRNETFPLQIHKHHLRQSTIRYIDVLIKLKLDSFR